MKIRDAQKIESTKKILFENTKPNKLRKKQNKKKTRTKRYCNILILAA